ncbi:MAG: glycosyltransferase family 4 protein [Ruminococcus sp.]|nr:glycosyltransferase family 4 protein [Ruminococcus sp.]
MKIYIDLSAIVQVDFVTGIQRVVREITVRMLKHPEHEFYLLYYSFKNNTFLRLSNERFLDYFLYGKGEKGAILTPEKIGYRDIPPGAVFFDIDSIWNSPLKRSTLFPVLKQNGVKIVTQIYDLIPVTDPQFCHDNTCANFMIFVGANLKYADLIITSAQTTVDVLNGLTDRLGIERKKAAVVKLSSDFAKKSLSDKQVDPEVEKIAGNSKYILMLGTIEPRKNHALLIDALESGLADCGVKVIFAGRIGWNVKELQKRINTHPLYGKKLFFFERPDDVTVDYLYKHAFAVAFPTFNEGFGLPIIEAFMRGTPVIASDIPVLHEVAGDYADYFDPHSKEDLIRCVKELLNSEERYAAKKARLKEYVPYTWDEAAEDMLDAVVSVSRNVKKVPADLKVKQLVCLTARNDDMLATLPFIEEFMPFITEMVLCCPDKNVAELKERYHGRLELKFLTDSQILNGEPLPEDHSTRNLFLRCLAMRDPVIDDVFIMTDDDYRPLRTLTIDDFIEDGCYKAFYCYDLNEWRGTYGKPTSFDISMRKTRKFLRDNGYPTMMYSSHQMQMIDKRIFNEMTAKYPALQTSGCCEWSTYFNYGLKTYPDMFKPVPYVTMGWPGARSDWDVFVQPTEFLFENHYKALYEEGRVFAGTRDDFHENVAEENQRKIMLFTAELQKQMESRQVYKAYCQSYWLQYREMPSFALIAGNDNNVAMCAPMYYQARHNGWTCLPFVVDRKIVDVIGSKKILLSHWFSDDAGHLITPIGRIYIDVKDLDFLLPVKSPDVAERCTFNIRILLEDKNMAADASIPTDIT